MPDNSDEKELKFGASNIDDDPNCITFDKNNRGNYRDVLLIGDNSYDTDEPDYVLQYGAYKLNSGYLLLPGKGENGIDMISRCKEHKVNLDTANPTSIRLPKQFSYSLKKIKNYTGYSVTKSTAILLIGGGETMFKDVIAKDHSGNSITYVRALGILQRYAMEHHDDLWKYSIDAGEYDAYGIRLIDRLEKNAFEYGINMDNKKRIPFSMSKHPVIGIQREKVSDGLFVFKETMNIHQYDMLCIMRALMLFDSSKLDKDGNNIPGLLSEEERINYSTIIGRFYDDVLYMIRGLDMGLVLEYPKVRTK